VFTLPRFVIGISRPTGITGMLFRLAKFQLLTIMLDAK